MASDAELGFPGPYSDEKELLLAWLRYLRGAVLRNIEGLTDEQAHWQPDGLLLSVAGVVNHLTQVEWRWIDGGYLGASVTRDEAEFTPGGRTAAELVSVYRQRAESTDATVRGRVLSAPYSHNPKLDLRWVLLHLINETARHAGHADATRELLDGTTGE